MHAVTMNMNAATKMPFFMELVTGIEPDYVLPYEGSALPLCHTSEAGAVLHQPEKAYEAFLGAKTTLPARAKYHRGHTCFTVSVTRAPNRTANRH